MTLIEDFQQSFVRITELVEKPANSEMLRLYALYKQATKGDANPKDWPEGFDFNATARFEAWLMLKGKSSAECMKEYIGLTEKLAS